MNYFCQITRHVPLILCFITPVSIFTTYGIAVANDHVSSFWPYISDTGTKPPESCIFGLLLSFIAVLLCAIIYIRYREVSEYSKLRPSFGISPLWNRVAACLGFISALGLHMVANFQELNEFITHIVGALMCFFSATLYFFMQTIFTRKMQPEAKLLLWIRIVFTLLNVLFIVGTFAPVGAALKEFKDQEINLSWIHPEQIICFQHQIQIKGECVIGKGQATAQGKEVLKWTQKDGGFHYHAISTFSEWLLVLSFCSYICTIFWDFRKIKIEPPQIKFISLEKGICEEVSKIETTQDDEVKNVWI